MVYAIISGIQWICKFMQSYVKLRFEIEVNSKFKSWNTKSKAALSSIFSGSCIRLSVCPPIPDKFELFSKGSLLWSKSLTNLKPSAHVPNDDKIFNLNLKFGLEVINSTINFE